MAKKKKSVKKGKKKHLNKPTSKKYSKYKVDGDSVTKIASFCPRCGPGIFLSEAKERKYCGKCHYTEFSGKKAEKIPSDIEPTKEVKAKKK